MTENQIEVNGIPYDILFVRREVDGSFLMLVEDAQEETYCLWAKEEGDQLKFYPADDQQIASVVKTYNEASANTLTYQGKLYEIAAVLGSIVIAGDPADLEHLYPFEMKNGAYVPSQLSEDDLHAAAELYKVRLSDNHEFLMDAETISRPSQNSGLKTICYLDGVTVQVDLSTDQKAGLLFIREGKYVTNPVQKMKLLQLFRKWEDEQFTQAMHFTLTNFPAEKADA